VKATREGRVAGSNPLDPISRLTVDQGFGIKLFLADGQRKARQEIVPGLLIRLAER
jgi:hypothetical protein